MELFLAGAWDSSNWLQVVLPPGDDFSAEGLRKEIYTFSRSSVNEADKAKLRDAVEAAILPFGKASHIFEAGIVWSALGVTPAAGAKIAINATINDRDDAERIMESLCFM